MSNDIAIGPAGFPAMAPVNKKPSYLILLDATSGKGKNLEKFIAVDKPELLSGFIQVKGFFTSESEEEITKSFATLLTETKKDLYVEMMFPWHRVCSVKSLVFKAK